MIEILEGVFFDPDKEWYKQSPELVQLAEEVMQTAPVDMEQEDCFGGGTRLIYGVWEYTSPLGVFSLRVSSTYKNAPLHKGFAAKALHDKVTITVK